MYLKKYWITESSPGFCTYRTFFMFCTSVKDMTTEQPFSRFTNKYIQCTSSCFISNRRLKGLHWEMFITTYVCYDCKLASVAEWIRQCTRNPEIVGSIPLEGKLFLIFFYLLRGWFPASRASEALALYVRTYYVTICNYV